MQREKRAWERRGEEGGEKDVVGGEGVKREAWAKEGTRFYYSTSRKTFKSMRWTERKVPS